MKTVAKNQNVLISRCGPSICAFANAYLPLSVHQIHVTLSLRMSETYAGHSESQHVQTQHGYGGPPTYSIYTLAPASDRSALLEEYPRLIERSEV